MTRADELRIADIAEAAEELAEVVRVGRQAFLDSAIRLRAAERLLEIIGEAASNLSEQTESGMSTSRGETSPGCASSWLTITSASTRSKCGLSRAPMCLPWPARLSAQRGPTTGDSTAGRAAPSA